MFDLNNKKIVVTGAAGLLGSKFSEVILKFNGMPIMLDIDFLKLKTISQRLQNKYNKEAPFFEVDITNEDNIKINSQTLKKKFSKIDALINNASFNPAFEKNKTNLNNNSFESFKFEQWNKEISVGLTGSFLCSKHYGTLISKNKNGGVIINISSDLGLIAPNQNIYYDKSKKKQYYKPISYSVVKSGIIGLTRYLSTYWADKNVRCNALCPGGIQTNQSKIFLKKIHELIPLKRMAKKDEYLSTIIWMLSDYSSYLNGAVISVDGGRTAW